MLGVARLDGQPFKLAFYSLPFARDRVETYVLSFSLRETLVGELKRLTELFVHRRECVERLVDLRLLEREFADEIFFTAQVPMREELVLGNVFHELLQRTLVVVPILFHLREIDVLVQLT